jgi:biopolymer transport protein ExbD
MKLQQKDNNDIEIDMSPMIDMVFLLLIFFLVASTIIDEKVPINVPTAAYARVPEDTTDRVVVAVNEKDEIFFGTQSAPLTLQQLKERLVREIAVDPELRIQIRSGRDVKYQMNEKIMKVCGEAGARDLIYAAFEE